VKWTGQFGNVQTPKVNLANLPNAKMAADFKAHKMNMTTYQDIKCSAMGTSWGTHKNLEGNMRT